MPVVLKGTGTHPCAWAVPGKTTSPATAAAVTARATTRLDDLNYPTSCLLPAI
jgi:hypothetical protein